MRNKRYLVSVCFLMIMCGVLSGCSSRSASNQVETQKALLRSTNSNTAMALNGYNKNVTFAKTQESNIENAVKSRDFTFIVPLLSDTAKKRMEDSEESGDKVLSETTSNFESGGSDYIDLPHFHVQSFVTTDKFLRELGTEVFSSDVFLSEASNYYDKVGEFSNNQHWFFDSVDKVQFLYTVESGSAGVRQTGIFSTSSRNCVVSIQWVDSKINDIGVRLST